MAMETIFHFRMDRDLEELLEAEVERLRENNPGMTIHKSDVVRSILYAELRHLATHEPIEGEAA